MPPLSSQQQVVLFVNLRSEYVQNLDLVLGGSELGRWQVIVVQVQSQPTALATNDFEWTMINVGFVCRTA